MRSIDLASALDKEIDRHKRRLTMLKQEIPHLEGKIIKLENAKEYFAGVVVSYDDPSKYSNPKGHKLTGYIREHIDIGATVVRSEFMKQATADLDGTNKHTIAIAIDYLRQRGELQTWGSYMKRVK